MIFQRLQIRVAMCIVAIMALLIVGVFWLQLAEKGRVSHLIDHHREDKEILLDELMKMRTESLLTMAYDYSWWNEMIAFVEHPDMEWAHENIDGGIATYKADAAWAFDTAGHLVYANVNETGTGLTGDSATVNEIGTSARMKWFGHFFVKSRVGLLEVCTSPMQPSSDSLRSSPARGYFATGRVWTPELVEEMQNVAGLNITIDLAEGSQPDRATDARVVDAKTTFVRQLVGPNDGRIGLLECDVLTDFQQDLTSALNRDSRFIWFFGIAGALLLGLALFFVLNLPLGEMLKYSGGLQQVASEADKVADGKRYGGIGGLIRSFYTRQTQLMAEISERRRAESALVQSEQRYRIVAEQTGQVVYDCDLKTGTVHWAGAIEKLTGYSPEQFASVDSRRRQDMIHPDDRPVAVALLEQASKTGSRYLAEYRMARQDGTCTFIEDSGNFLKDESGHPYRMLGAMNDITQKKLADEARRLEESRLETLLKIHQMIHLPEAAIYRFAMEEAVRLTSSEIGYIGLVSEDQQVLTIVVWAEGVMRGCAVNEKPLEIAVEPSSLLCHPILERRVILVNNYEGTSLPKRGTPEGHLQIKRFAAAPVSDNGRIVLVAGVANKAGDYDSADGRRLSLLMSGLWSILRRKRTEQRLQVSENQYRAIFETANDAIFLMTGDTFVDCNAKTLEMFACTKEQIVGQPPYRFSPEFQPDGKPSVDKALDKINAALAGQPQCFEWVHSRYDGVLFDAEVSLNRFEIADQVMILAVVRDITERKQAEQDLHRTRAFLDTAVAQSPAAILIASAPDATVKYANALANTIWGDGYSALTGRPLADVLSSWQIFDTDETTCLVIEAFPLFRAIQTGISVLNQEIVLSRGDSITCWLSISASPIRNQRGDVVAGMAIIQDISQIRRADKEQRELQDKLQRAQRMESLGLLAGGVAHDLNNMLGPVVGYAELLARQLSDTPVLAARANKIVKSAQDSANVIQDLLTLARRGRYEMRPVDLNTVLQAFFESPGVVGLRERHPNVTLRLETGATTAVIQGSESHLPKVFMNLVANACEAMPDGGTLTVFTENRHLDQLLSGFAAISPGEFVVVHVKDTGTGIAKADIAKIFEPYYSKKQMGQSGTGLGLAIVYGVVKDHGGYYDVFSEVGKGTEFVLYFPVSTETAKERKRQVGVIGGHESVLVVDDSVEQCELARDILAGLGYKVSTSLSGRKAVEYLSRHDADLVLLDMVMEQDFDGLDTARAIYAMKSNQKIVIVSGFTATDRVTEMQSLGAGPYLRKPYTVDALGGIVRAVLDNSDISVLTR